MSIVYQSPIDYKGDIDNVLERINLSDIIKTSVLFALSSPTVGTGCFAQNIIIGHYKNGVAALLPLDSNSYTNIYLTQIGSEFLD